MDKFFLTQKLPLIVVTGLIVWAWLSILSVLAYELFTRLL